jgi:transposase InsO family protein
VQAEGQEGDGGAGRRGGVHETRKPRERDTEGAAVGQHPLHRTLVGSHALRRHGHSKTYLAHHVIRVSSQRACPIRIRTTLTDYGKEFTDRLFGLRKRAATGEHEFDQLCSELGIEHRLTPPKSPQTNGMVERFNGRIEEVLQSHHFRSGEELETTLHRCVRLYNQ